jgi:hypothetical protein
MTGGDRFIGQAFGLRWASDCAIPWFTEVPDDGRVADVQVERVPVVEPRRGGIRFNHGELFEDGTRFHFEGAVFDMIGGKLIRWFAPHLDEVPLALGSTVAAQLLAWRGMVPLHGSAVAFDGVAILLAGASGAGKSTLADALVGCGGQLVSDDLSVLLPIDGEGPPMLVPGRTAIRLSETIGAGKDEGKRLSWPGLVDANHPVPLSMLLLLRDEPIPSDPRMVAATLAAQLFRPGWMRRLPNAKARAATLLIAAQRIAFATLPPASRVREVSPADRAREAISLWQRHLSR